jgi:hypothetical protein
VESVAGIRPQTLQAYCATPSMFKFIWSVNPNSNCEGHPWAKKDMRAICWRHVECTLTRQCRLGRVAKRPGRPIVLLWSYLSSAHLYAKKEAHKDAWRDWAALPARAQARADFEALGPRVQQYIDAEVPPAEGVVGREPFEHDL